MEQTTGTRTRYGILALIMAVGVAVRLWGMSWPPFPIDMNDWIAWGEHVLRAGPGGFYTDTLFADYAPGYVYVMWLTAAIKHAFLPDANAGTYYFLYRFPPLLFDLATTALIFLTIERDYQTREAPADQPRPERTGLFLAAFAALCYILNPAIIFNSAIWGQIDASFTFFMLLAIVLLLRGQAEGAVASYVVAFLVKPQAISLAPVLGLVLLLRYPMKHWLRASVIGLVLAYIILLPFLGLNAFGRLITLLNKSVETYPYTSLFTYNLWGIYGFWKDDTIQVGAGITLRLLGTLLYLIGIVYGALLLWRQLKRTSSDTLTIFFFATYFTFLPVMVLTRMHERYLYPVLPFLIIFAFLYGSHKLPDRITSLRHSFNVPFLLYLAVTVLHTINLYYVYTYYLNYNTGGVDPANTLFYSIERYEKLWSVLTLLIFGVIVLTAPEWSLPRNQQQRAFDERVLDSEPA